MGIVAGVTTAVTLYQKVKPLLEDENVKRYGSMLLKGGKTVIGHLESKKNKSTGGILLANGQQGGVTQELAGNATNVVSGLAQNGSKMLGGLTSLGWANLAVSGINLGVTVVGMVVLSKKMDKVTAEVQQMNGKLDGILQEMHQIKAMVAQLNDNEIRKLYSEANRGIQHMRSYSAELSYNGKYNDSLRREVQHQLDDSKVFLEDIMGRYTDPNCNIALGLDVIMAYFYTFISLVKSYISAVYMYDKDLLDYMEYESALRRLCSRTMVESITALYRTSPDSFLAPQDLGVITSLYKGIMVEQISEVKSQRQILELVGYEEYRRINERLLEDSSSDEVAFISYAY